MYSFSQVPGLQTLTSQRPWSNSASDTFPECWSSTDFSIFESGLIFGEERSFTWATEMDVPMMNDINRANDVMSIFFIEFSSA
jgi:hypothetical protein